MKKFVIVLAAAMLAASPALAKKYRMPLASGPTYQTTDQGYAAYAYAPERASRIEAGHTDAVYADGQYLGADPDLFIRQQLLRDPPSDMQ
jgi:opacity protein-like surface antigen